MKIAFRYLDNDAYRLIFYQQQTGWIPARHCLADASITGFSGVAIYLVQEKMS
jgi:hypothetical protein